MYSQADDTDRDTLLRHARLHRATDKARREPEVSVNPEEGHIITGPDDYLELNETTTLRPTTPTYPGSRLSHSIGSGAIALPSLNSDLSEARSPVPSANANSSICNSEETFPTTLLSENVDADLRNQPNVWPALWEGSLGMEWSSWLAGSDFDLDSVNHSLNQAVELHPEQSIMVATNNFSSTAGERAIPGHESSRVQRKWHTFSEAMASGQTTPSVLQERSHEDQAYRQELAEKLRPRVQAGILPSTKFLVCRISFNLAMLARWTLY